MEHACNQCGTVVEDGQPFCANCRAPQIRVPVRPPTAPATEPLPPGTPEDVQPPAEPMSSERNVLGMPQPEALHRAEDAGVDAAGDGEDAGNRLIWRPALGSALVAGMLAAVGTSIPIVPLAMLCMFASGGLAVTLYRRRAGFHRVTPWMGAKLGLLAGGLGFGMLALLSLVGLVAASQRAKTREVLLEKLQDAVAAAADSDVRQGMEQLRGYIATDHGLIIVVLCGMAMLGVILLTFSALGGALGGALFGRDSGHKEP